MNAKSLEKELLKVLLRPIACWLGDPALTDILVYGYLRRNRAVFQCVEASWLSDADLMTAAKIVGRHMAPRLERRWLSRAEFTDDETLLTFHYQAGTWSIRGLKPLFSDAIAGVVGEVRECGGPPRANGLWVTLFAWNFVTPEAA
jgi:hypothetical protein